MQKDTKNNDLESLSKEFIKWAKTEKIVPVRESDFDNSYIDEQEYRILINTDLPTKKYPRIAELIPEYYYNDKNGKHYNILNFDRKSIKEIICNSDEARKAVEKKITDIPIRMRKEN